MSGEGQILLVECADRPGLVHGITGVLLRHQANVVGNQEFVDRELGRFFMRTEFDCAVDALRLEAEVRALLPACADVRCTRLHPAKVVIIATHEHHCLADLLVRHAHGELNANVQAVVANRPDLEKLTARFELPFHCVPVENLERTAHEAKLLAAIEPYAPDFLVLAKYMRVLSPAFVARFPHRIVNIHHSFLPAFAGARPYHQAFARGVKVIGATAHFVTDELDAGPIITQQVLPVDHTHTGEDLAVAGRDVERIALGRALKLVFEQRVFICGRRTIIFD
jgi:formyltetrahydrofolate deformylase